MSQVLHQLRTALGWERSVVHLGGVYQLDPEARWDYDADLVRAGAPWTKQFLVGVRTEWVNRATAELARAARQARTGRRRATDL